MRQLGGPTGPCNPVPGVLVCEFQGQEQGREVRLDQVGQHELVVEVMGWGGVCSVEPF